MPDIIIIIFFCYTNSKIAKAKSLNPTAWILTTIAAIVAFMFIGSFIVVLNYKGALDMVSIQNFLYQNPLKILTFYALEIGGGLLVRFILERKINTKNTSE